VIFVVKLFWNLYGWVYDAALLELMPYQNMLGLAGEALSPHKGGRYIDVGCGTGIIISRLKDINKDITVLGADNSEVMLKRATKKMADKEGSVFFHKLDLNKVIPFDNNFFDGATCINVLYILEQPDILIKELHRVLKKNCRLIIATPLNEPKLMPVIKEHIDMLKNEYSDRWRIILAGQIVRIFIPALVSIILNLFIVKNKKYVFFKEVELRSLIEVNGFLLKDVKPIYGQQVLFMLAEKC